MRLNKILMLTLSGCAIFAPIALTSCNTNGSNLPANTISIPFYDELYDTFNNEVYICLTEDTTRPAYEIQDINKWYQEESNNNRKYKWEKVDVSYDENNTLAYDYFSLTDFVNGSNLFFNSTNEFYKWIRKDTFNYNFYFYNGDPANKKEFKFDSLNWESISNPNCYVILFVTTYSYDKTITTNNKRYVWKIIVNMFPKEGYEWYIDRKGVTESYNNRKFMEFTFEFPNINGKYDWFS
ncbi:hypothetical protein [Malacoplasma muris]|uniref:hypothetical protein n=1 Tax=Malacoplasma muris TaxID=2119 RepID=UPI00398EC7A0